MKAEHLYHKRWHYKYPVAVRAKGIWIYDETGAPYIDAIGGSYVVSIGHSVREVADAIARQARTLCFPYVGRFTTRPELKLADCGGSGLLDRSISQGSAEPSFKQVRLSGLPEFLQNSQLGFPVTIADAALLAGLVALALGPPIMRLSGMGASVATFAFLMIVNSTYSNWDSVTGGLSSIIGIPAVVGPWTALGFALAALAVAYLFHVSRFGLMLRASRDEEVAAKAPP